MIGYSLLVRRIAAAGLDYALFLPLAIAIAYLGPVAGRPLLLVGLTVANFAYRVGFHARWGATLGKRWLGLRVRHLHRPGPLGWMPAIRREFISVISTGIYLWESAFLANERTGQNLSAMNLSAALGLVDGLWIIGNPGQRALHDYVAATQVDLTDEVARKDFVFADAPPPPGYEFATSLRRGAGGFLNILAFSGSLSLLRGLPLSPALLLALVPLPAVILCGLAVLDRSPGALFTHVVTRGNGFHPLTTRQRIVRTLPYFLLGVFVALSNAENLPALSPLKLAAGTCLILVIGNGCFGLFQGFTPLEQLLGTRTYRRALRDAKLGHHSGSI